MSFFAGSGSRNGKKTIPVMFTIALALAGGAVTHIPGYAVPVVDTTGAGDIYAAGVLYGLATGMDDAAAGKLGSFASARIVTRMGPRLAERLENQVNAILNGADPTKEL